MKHYPVIAFIFLSSSATLLQAQEKKDSTLLPGTKNLQQVTITAGAFDASDKAKGASLTPIDAVTVAGNGGDISMALRYLPGAQQIGETEGLFVRGGTASETKQFIDGSLMPHPNYPSVPGIIQYARVNPFLFKGILFSTGGYSALYGQAMSSALILESDDLPDKSSYSFSLFPSNAAAGFQRLTSNRFSYGATVRYSNQQLYNRIVPQRPDFFAGPSYTEADANFRWRVGKTGMLKFYTNWSNSNVGMRNQDIDSAALRDAFQVKGMNNFSTLSYRDRLSDSWRLDASAGYNYLHVSNRNQLIDAVGAPVNLDMVPYQYKDLDSRNAEQFAQGRVVLTHYFPGNEVLRFGAEQFYTHEDGVSNDTLLRSTNYLTAVFGETDIMLTDRLAVKAGARLEYASLLNKWNPAPRISLAWKAGSNSQFNAAYGIFFQDASQASHYILNYTYKASNRLFRAEAYYKEYKRLPTLLPTYGYNGNGYAKGIELFFRDKRTIKNLDYWITYTYLDASRHYMDYPYSMRPNYTSPHTATIAIKQQLPQINTFINLSWAFATGRPYYNIQYTNDNQHTYIADQGSTPVYNTVNLHVAWLTSFFKGSKWKDFSGIGAGVGNLLGNKQVFGYQYSYNGQAKTAITPPATRNFYIGIFMSFGKDRTNDILDNLN
ncbi:outer membrane receptor for ferrienterochelin and colicin [Chitinophaga dinghuensis]|uniref:Outer membrane receptor for ferrienterochelin and colicin n=1 Tax=Chitinophaga dinghuensis TaxID=1539050 RepID=A0A327WC47_9BACT|nr:TonB-dependent receptor plug domain-containing protein [Chitinophaga dinghuensis]RAJ87779.1 outer membrane receptor for ferrienterochelin and colicin [Chitinophaga dinghuensis]